MTKANPITISLEVLNILSPKAVMLLEETANLKDNSFKLHSAIPGNTIPGEEAKSKELIDSSDNDIYAVKLKYINDKTGKALHIPIRALLTSALMATDAENKPYEKGVTPTKQVYEHILGTISEGNMKEASLPTEITVVHCEDELWEGTENPRFPNYYYKSFNDAVKKFQEGKPANTSILPIYQDEVLMQGLKNEKVEPRFTDKPCLKRIVLQVA